MGTFCSRHVISPEGDAANARREGEMTLSTSRRVVRMEVHRAMSTNHYPTDSVVCFLTHIYWIAIYRVTNVIQPSNNCGLWPVANCEAAWPSGQRDGLAIRRSRVRVPPSADHYLDLFLGSPEFESSAALVNSQLVCLWPVGILNYVMFNLKYLFHLFARPH